MPEYGKHDQIIFKLGGKALKAAKLLHFGHYKIIEQKNGSYDNLLQSFKNVSSDKVDINVIDVLGIEQGQHVLSFDNENHPRTYYKRPQIYAVNLSDKAEYFLFSNIGYRGGHFIPTDSIELGQKDHDSLIYKLHGSDWEVTPPIMGIREEPCAVPNDFDKSKHLYSALPNLILSSHIRIAGNQTKKLLDDIDLSLEQYNQREREAEDIIKIAIAEILNNSELRSLDQDKKFIINVNIIEDNEDSIVNTASASVDIYDKKGFGESLVTSVKIPKNIYFTMVKINKDKVLLNFKNNEHGRQLKEAVQNVGSYIKISDFNYFKNIKNDNFPYALKFDNNTLLMYGSENNSPEFCSSLSNDCPEMSPILYNWLRNDEIDIKLYGKAPPMPKELKVELNNLRTDLLGAINSMSYFPTILDHS